MANIIRSTRAPRERATGGKIMTERYNIIATIESPEKDEIKTFNWDCSFFKNDDDYGNGTHLRFGPHYFDIRYDSDYKEGHEITYLAQTAGEMWCGENGAWQLIGLQIQSIIPDIENVSVM